MLHRALMQLGSIRCERQTRGHATAFDAVAQHVDRGAEGDFVFAHRIASRMSWRLIAPIACTAIITSTTRTPWARHGRAFPVMATMEAGRDAKLSCGFQRQIQLSARGILGSYVPPWRSSTAHAPVWARFASAAWSVAVSAQVATSAGT